MKFLLNILLSYSLYRKKKKRKILKKFSHLSEMTSNFNFVKRNCCCFTDCSFSRIVSRHLFSQTEKLLQRQRSILRIWTTNFRALSSSRFPSPLKLQPVCIPRRSPGISRRAKNIPWTRSRALLVS